MTYFDDVLLVLNEYNITMSSIKWLASSYKQERLCLIEVPTSLAFEAWQRLANAPIPYYPVLGNWQPNFFEDSPASSVISQATQSRLDNWFHQDLLGKAPPASWLKEYPLHIELPLSFSILKKYRTLATIPLTLVPTSLSWQVPAFLHYSIPDGPPAFVHTALWRQWEEEYQARVVCIDHSIVEFSVGSPLTSMEKTMQLAELQSLYCPDLVDQWAWGLKNLAKVLYNSTIWYFWWD